MVLGAVISLFLTGCGADSSRQESSNADLDIAMVERMNRVPPRPLSLDVITASDIAHFGLAAMNCTFSSANIEPVFMGGANDGVIKVDGDLQRLAARTQSAELPGDARTVYVGPDRWAELSRLPDAGTGAGRNRFPARLTIHDAHERIVFISDGVVHCAG